MYKLLPRDKFREAVFARDGFKCVCCNAPAVDAHHILERRLFPDGGYYIENGVSLCERHHLDAEQTVISPAFFYEKLGVKRVLPQDMYDEFEYTKWGDIILANGLRLKGPLFEDESVQKILQSGDMLRMYCKYVKYPRTFHLPWSESRTDDDKTLQNVDNFKGKQVVVTLKMDGEQSTGYDDGYVHARSIDGEPHHTQSWVRNYLAKVLYDLPKDWRINGENVFAKHSIKYDDLESYFYMFAIWDEKNNCLSWADTLEWAKLLGLNVVQPIYEGLFDEKLIKKAFEAHKSKHEGYVIRLADKFHYSGFKSSVAKFVRANHIQTSNHWKFERIERNGLRSC